MDIGSAKVDSKSQAEVPHHLINVADIKDSFSAAEYYNLAKPCLEVHIYTLQTVTLYIGRYSIGRDFSWENSNCSGRYWVLY